MYEMIQDKVHFNYRDFLQIPGISPGNINPVKMIIMNVFEESDVTSPRGMFQEEAEPGPGPRGHVKCL